MQSTGRGIPLASRRSRAAGSGSEVLHPAMASSVAGRSHPCRSVLSAGAVEAAARRMQQWAVETTGDDTDWLGDMTPLCCAPSSGKEKPDSSTPGPGGPTSTSTASVRQHNIEGENFFTRGDCWERVPCVARREARQRLRADQIGNNWGVRLSSTVTGPSWPSRLARLCGDETQRPTETTRLFSSVLDGTLSSTTKRARRARLPSPATPACA